MRMYGYLENTTKHLLLINADAKLTLNDFTRELSSYWKEIRIKKKVLKLFYDSMSNSGYLCLGNTEEIHLLRYVENFIIYKPGYNIYRKSIAGIMGVGTNE